MTEMAKRGKMRQVAANHGHSDLKNRRFTFVKSCSAMPDEQAAAKGGRMLLWRLWHHSHELESVCLFPGFIDQENLSLPGRILQAIGPAENDRTPRSDIILFLEP